MPRIYVVEDDEEQLPVITTKSKVKELDDEDEEDFLLIS